MLKFFQPRIEEIKVERKGNLSKDVNISLNADEIKEENGFLEIKYNFIIKNGENKIIIKGIIFGKGNKEELEKFIQYWNENKKIKKELFVALYNFLMVTLFPKIVALSDMVGLPAPVNLPLIKENQLKEAEENKKEEDFEDLE